MRLTPTGRLATLVAAVGLVAALFALLAVRAPWWWLLPIALLAGIDLLRLFGRDALIPAY